MLKKGSTQEMTWLFAEMLVILKDGWVREEGEPDIIEVCDVFSASLSTWAQVTGEPFALLCISEYAKLRPKYVDEEE